MREVGASHKPCAPDLNVNPGSLRLAKSEAFVASVGTIRRCMQAGEASNMSYSSSIDPDKLKEITEAVRDHTLIPFIGPGVSREAAIESGVSLEAGHPYPTLRELIEMLFKLATGEVKDKDKARNYITQTQAKKIQTLLNAGKHLVAAEPIRYSWPKEDYRDTLIKTFNPKNITPSKVHKALFGLEPPLILTTNYDCLLEDAYAAKSGKAPTVYTYNRTAAVQKAFEDSRSLNRPDRPTIFKLHGTINEPLDIVLSDADYRNVISKQLGYLSLLSTIFITHNVLLLGFSPSDLELILLLDTLHDSLKYDTTPDFIFLSTKTDPTEIKEFEKKYNIRNITPESSDGKADMLKFINLLLKSLET
jgi:hypothetical protein